MNEVINLEYDHEQYRPDYAESNHKNLNQSLSLKRILLRYDYDFSIITTPRIKRIIGDDCEITFLSDPLLREDINCFSSNTTYCIFPFPAKRITRIQTFRKKQAEKLLLSEVEFFSHYAESENFATFLNYPNANKRLVLDSLSYSAPIHDIGRMVTPYKFEYYNVNGQPEGSLICNRMTYAKDFAGFYNRKNNTKLVPHVYVYDGEENSEFGGSDHFRLFPSINGTLIAEENEGADISCDTVSQKMGLLKTVINPDGSRVDYDYGSHEFIMYANEPVITGGGIRIRKKTLTTANSVSSTFYKYYGGHTANKMHAGYFDPKFSYCQTTPYYTNKQQRLQYGYVVNDYGIDFGGVTYDSVEVYYDSGNKGKTVYVFNNTPNSLEPDLSTNLSGCSSYSTAFEMPHVELYSMGKMDAQNNFISSAQAGMTPELDLSYNGYPYPDIQKIPGFKGALLKQREYIKKNEQYVIRNNQSFSYELTPLCTNFNITPITALKIGYLKNNAGSTCNGVNSDNIFAVGVYKVVPKTTYSLTGSVVTYYDDQGQGISSESYYRYNTQNQLTGTAVVKKDEPATITYTTYVADCYLPNVTYSPSPSGTQSVLINQLVEQNQCNIPLESISMKTISPVALGTNPFTIASSNLRVVSAGRTLWKTVSNGTASAIVPQSTEALYFDESLPYMASGGFFPLYRNTSTNEVVFDSRYATTDPLLKTTIAYLTYDSRFRVTETISSNGITAVSRTTDADGLCSSTVTASNASSGEVIYKSFETDGERNDPPYYSVLGSTTRTSSDVFAGKYALQLAVNTNLYLTIVPQPRHAGYTCLTWVKSDASVTVEATFYNGTSTISQTSKVFTPPAAGGWFPVKLVLGPDQSTSLPYNKITFRISSASTSPWLADEVRVFPTDANPVFSTFNSLGMAVTSSDANNNYVRPYYDGSGSLIYQKDTYGNITQYNESQNGNPALFVVVENGEADGTYSINEPLQVVCNSSGLPARDFRLYLNGSATPVSQNTTGLFSNLSFASAGTNTLKVEVVINDQPYSYSKTIKIQ
ncbi:MAG: hypothetical protein PHQ65_08390 [Bacteroidales bacterium]|nr:hypothetical protein [Bacteroidales bacterium]